MLVSPSNASSQPQPITFDWNDAAEAVSYTIQVDNSSSFTAPLVREQSVTDVDRRDVRPWHRRPTSGGFAASTRRASPDHGRRCAASPRRLLRHRRSCRRSTSIRPRVVGGNISSGTVVMSTSAHRRCGDLVVEQQPGGRQRAGDDHGAARVHRHVRRSRLLRSPRPPRSRSRPRYNGVTRSAHADGHADRRRPDLAEHHGQPVERCRWHQHIRRS